MVGVAFICCYLYQLGPTVVARWDTVYLFSLRPCPLISRSSCEIIFHWNALSPNLFKSKREILIKHVRKLHKQVAHDLIVDLQLAYFCIILCRAKLPSLVTKVTKLQNYKLNLVST